MDPKELENLIEALFESTHFKLLLAEEFRNGSSLKQSKFNQAQAVMEDISEDLYTIVHFKLKQSIDEDLMNMVPNVADYRKEIDQLKADIQKLQQNAWEGDDAEGSQRLKSLLSADKLAGSSVISDRTKSTLNSESLQLAKVKQELDHLKVTVGKLSSNNLLQFVSEAHLEMNNKMDDNFARLSTEINELSIRHSEPDLDRSMHSVLNLSCENQLPDRIQEKMQKYLKEMEAKLQCGLRSVWNVITQLQNNLNPKRNSPEEMHESPSQKTIRKGTKFGSLLGWKS